MPRPDIQAARFCAYNHVQRVMHFWQTFNNFCKAVTKSDINKISSAWSITKIPDRASQSLPTSSMYTANINGTNPRWFAQIRFPQLCESSVELREWSYAQTKVSNCPLKPNFNPIHKIWLKTRVRATPNESYIARIICTRNGTSWFLSMTKAPYFGFLIVVMAIIIIIIICC